MSEAATHEGSCMCGKVAFEVETDLEGLIECNCSHCHRKGLILKFVPADKFNLLHGEGDLAEFRFNKHRIEHLFCKTCGVEVFARGKGPDGSPIVAVNVRTLEDVEPGSYETKRVDGRSF
jgi:hypothetical protein